jgi:hypothetical protein
MLLKPDTILQGRYHIKRLIAQGGMGAVYEAQDTRLGNTVALKQTLMTDPKLRAAFEREARLLAGLQHPVLPIVSDHFAEADGEFLVMQYIPGDDLATAMIRRSTPFALHDVLNWADQLLDALDYLHTQNPPIIHRDIKPQNLKLTPRGKIVLLDFGLAKGSVGADSTSGARSVFGYTPQYAPIEQIQGTGTDPRSDLYALAATLYELLTGTTPPDGLTRASETVAGRSDPLQPAHTLNPSIPSGLSALLHQAMDQNPAMRPASAAAMSAALQAATGAPSVVARGTSDSPAPNSAGMPTVAMRTASDFLPPPIAATTPTNDTRRKHSLYMPWILGIGIALVFLILAAGAGAVVLVRGERTPIAAPLPLVGANDDGNDDGGALVGLSQRGASRSDPLAPSETARLPGWEIELAGDVVRGNEAWQLIYETNRLNDEPPEGYEYLLVRLRVRTSFVDAERNLRTEITGDRNIEYSRPATVAPDALPREIATAQQVEGYVPFLVPAGEANLILKFDDLDDFDSVPVFMALEPGNAVAVDPQLREIPATELGRDFREPAPLGDTVVSEDWELRVREVIRGDQAYDMLIETNRYNDPPPDGQEYIAVYLEVRLIGTEDDTELLDNSDFSSVRATTDDPEADRISYPSVVGPAPELSTYLYPGGRGEGWIAVLAPIDTPEMLLIFEPSYSLDHVNTRFLMLNE